ncbi:hypothetical protein QZH41_010813 [Actinostola sp. cb2023]|nr:hypothetical protein QZH41_010813 [Actinostola sp. cb2023]
MCRTNTIFPQFSNWKAETVSSHNILKLIYQGRFLHGNVTLGALHLSLGKRTTMHLVARENLPEPASQGTITSYTAFTLGKNNVCSE